MKTLVLLLAAFATFAKAQAPYNAPGMEGATDTAITSNLVGYGLDSHFLLNDYLLAALNSDADVKWMATVQTAAATDSDNTVRFTVNLHGGGLFFPEPGPNYVHLCSMTLPLPARAGETYRVEVRCNMKQYFVSAYGNKAYTSGFIRVTNERTGAVREIGSTEPDSQDGYYDVAGLWLCNLEVFQTAPNLVTIYDGSVFRNQ